MRVCLFLAIAAVACLPASAQERQSKETENTKRSAATLSQRATVEKSEEFRAAAERGEPLDIDVGTVRRATRARRVSTRRPRTQALRRAQVAQFAGQELNLQTTPTGVEEEAFLDFSKWEWHKPNKMSAIMSGAVFVSPLTGNIQFMAKSQHLTTGILVIHYHVHPDNVGKPHVLALEGNFMEGGRVSVMQGAEDYEINHVEMDGGEQVLYELEVPQKAGLNFIRVTAYYTEGTAKTEFYRASVNVVN